MAMRQISVRELKARLDDASSAKPLLLDVREAWEYEICHIDGSTPIPLGRLMERRDELAAHDPATEIVAICHHGVRSFQACMLLRQAGFPAVANLQGGVAAWASEVDPTMPHY